MVNDETEGEPPDGKENVTKPPGDSVFSTGVNRSIAPVVFWNLCRTGAGTSRGVLVSYLCDNLQSGCDCDPYTDYK